MLLLTGILHATLYYDAVVVDIYRSLSHTPTPYYERQLHHRHRHVSRCVW